MSLRLLAARPDLQRRIRSATGCYLDLGDFADVARTAQFGAGIAEAAVAGAVVAAVHFAGGQPDPR